MLQSTALIIQSCGVLSVSWSCCKADFADSETMKAEDKEADGSLFQRCSLILENFHSFSLLLIPLFLL